MQGYSASVLSFIREYKDLITFLIGMATAGLLLFAKWKIGSAIKALKTAADQAKDRIESTSNNLDETTTKIKDALSKGSALLETAGNRLLVNVDKMDERLGASAADFDRRVNAAIDQRQQELLIAVDQAGEALRKKVQGIKTEIASEVAAEVEQAAMTAMQNGVSTFTFETEQEFDEDEKLRWDEMSLLWTYVKQDVDYLLDAAREELADGRSLRRYSNISKHHYDDIAIKLYQDNRMSEEAVDAVIEMNAIFQSKRNRKSPVTSDDFKEFKMSSDIWFEENRGGA